MLFLKQVGYRWVHAEFFGGDAPYEVMKSTQDRLDRYGIKIHCGIMYAYHSLKIQLGQPGRDQDIEKFQTFLRDLGRLGIPVAHIDFHPGNTYTTSMIESPRGYTAREFSLDDLRKKVEKQMYERQYSAEEIWANYTYFLKAVVPVAEKANVRLAHHPDDPPLVMMNGVAKVFINYDGYQHAEQIAGSKNWGLCLCVGTWAEGGANMGKDVFGMIQDFGGRGKIFTIHFRNVSTPLPRFNETCQDDGYLDMYQVVKALRQVRFSGSIRRGTSKALYSAFNVGKRKSGLKVVNASIEATAEGKTMNRRRWMILSAAELASGRVRAQQSPRQTAENQQPPASRGLLLEQYQPKSMLHVPETHVPRPRFPVIDFHTHITWGEASGGIRLEMDPAKCLPTMDRKDVRMMVSVTGGYGEGLREALRALCEAYPGRFVVFTEPVWAMASDPGYPQFQANQIEDAHKAGAKGLKILKTLGIYLRERGTNQLVRVDDPRFDPMWEAAGTLHMPVIIHVSDPEAFFLPIDRFNERWEELHAHPDWSFYGKDFPSNRELQEARRNIMRRHPRTQFVCAHVADSEDLPYVSECMDNHPNMIVDIGARIGELGRQPRMSRKFFDKYQDRIVFGTDACAKPATPQQIFGDELYEIYYRFLETEDEYFDYAPAPIPPQGRWRIYGLGLPEQLLRKVYWDNAARLLGLSA